MTDAYLAAALAGRCANGYEHGQGSRIHAVPASETLARNGYCTTPAACGAKPGPRSAGWSLRSGEPVSCPRCLKRTDGVSATFHCDHHHLLNKPRCAQQCNSCKSVDEPAFDPARPWRAHQHSPGSWSVVRDPLPDRGVVEYMPSMPAGKLTANEAKRIAAGANVPGGQ